MPLTQPAAPGIDRRALIAGRDLYVNSSGIDNGINFQSVFRDVANDRVLIGGDNSFVGFLAKIKGAGIIQSAALPSTVVANGNITRIKPNVQDGGVLVKSSGAGTGFARTGDGGATWVSIGGGLRAFGYVDITSWKDDQLVASVGTATNLDVSADNGATWPDAISSQASGTPTTFFIFTDINQTKIIVGTTTAIQISEESDLTVPGNWTNFDMSGLLTAAGWNGWAVNDAGSKAVFLGNNAEIIITADNFNTFFLFDPDKNPFINAAGTSGPPFWVVYWPAEDGFLIVGQNATPPSIFFIPADGGMTEGISGFLLGNTAPAFLGNNSCVSDGDECMVVNGANLTFQTLPLKP